jgi:hypothetical protein
MGSVEQPARYWGSTELELDRQNRDGTLDHGRKFSAATDCERRGQTPGLTTDHPGIYTHDSPRAATMLAFGAKCGRRAAGGDAAPDA